MAFTLNHDGTITTDTAAELLEIADLRRLRLEREAKSIQEELARRRAAKSEEVVTRVFVQVPSETASEISYRQLYEGMADQPKQQALLRALFYKAPVALSDDELRVKLALTSNLDLRGLLIGIIRRANNKGIDSPIRKDMTRSDGGRKRHYRYTVSGAFRDAMADYKFGGALLESAS